MKKFVYCVICVIIIIGLTQTSVLAENGIEPPVSPKVEAYGAILIDMESGRILWEKDAFKTLAMASTTKIMTAVVAIENCGLDEIVEVSKRAAAAPPVKMYLTAGEKIPLRTLMYALMLQSSNDAAVAIAEHVGGSVENFCKMMTKKARDIGAYDTSFETPNGLDTDNHYSTAYDMAQITRYAFNIPEFVKIINTRDITLKSDRSQYVIHNKNRFLDEFSGANGVKTGYTGKAGYCFVGAVKKNDMQFISVVLGSGWGKGGKEQKWIDTKRIMKYGVDNYRVTPVLEEGEPAAEVAVERSKTYTAPLIYGESVFIPLREDEAGALKIVPDVPVSVKAPVSRGDTIGEAKIFINGEYYKTVGLICCMNIERHDLKTSFEKAIKSLLALTTEKEIEVTLPEFDFWALADF